jgi:[acyl-carrier-protein] S-malonyltransferase
MKTTLLFSGQGSQYVGMMKDIYESVPEAKRKIELADEIMDFELSSVCFEGPSEKLKETRYTQPALCLHSCVLFDLIKDKIIYYSLAGHSVGEYAALYAAGVLSFEDTLRLVKLRGSLMFGAGEIMPGTMFAVINLEEEKLEELCSELTDDEAGLYVVPANYNSPGQIVVSGSAEYLRSNAGKFKDAGAKIVKEISVSGAFHSPLMEPAKMELEEAILNINFSDAEVPIYSNVTAIPSTESHIIKDNLIRQLTSPVLWTQTLVNMKNDGFSRYIEIGPGKVLQGLVKRTLTEVEIEGIDSYEDAVKYF